MESENKTIGEREYVQIKRDSLEDWIYKASVYAYDSSSRNVLTASEKMVFCRSQKYQMPDIVYLVRELNKCDEHQLFCSWCFLRARSFH